MKKYKLSLDLEFHVDVPEGDTVEEQLDDGEILDLLADQIALNNETVENIFWDGMEVREVK